MLRFNEATNGLLFRVPFFSRCPLFTFHLLPHSPARPRHGMFELLLWPISCFRLVMDTTANFVVTFSDSFLSMLLRIRFSAALLLFRSTSRTNSTRRTVSTSSIAQALQLSLHPSIEPSSIPPMLYSNSLGVFDNFLPLRPLPIPFSAHVHHSPVFSIQLPNTHRFRQHEVVPPRSPAQGNSGHP